MPAPDEFRPLSHTISGAVKTTGISRSRLYEHIKAGELKTFKDRKRTLIADEDLRALVAFLRRGGAQ